MGVLGLWRLIDAAGKPVPLETLEGKVLAIDVSIWIHQVLQGYQDRKGNALPNAHLIGLFNRICKLLYFKIKPVFVFDGKVPMLKKNTIASRRKQKSAAANKAQKLKNDLINNLIKHAAVKNVLDKDASEPGTSQQPANLLSARSKTDMFILPDIPSSSQELADESADYESDYESPEELSPRKQSKWIGNIHQVNVGSSEFKNLPADVRYDILTDLKETRKQNSWGRLHEMPEESNCFSEFQMKRLLKRRFVQESLEEAEKEMGGKTLTMEELEKLMTEQGIATSDRDTAYRIASDNTTRIIYINDKNAVKEKCTSETPSSLVPEADVDQEIVAEKELDSRPSTSKDESVAVIDNLDEYDLDSDWESESEFVEPLPMPKNKVRVPSMNPAMMYMLEHSNLTQNQIISLMEQAKKNQEIAGEKDDKNLGKSRTSQQGTQGVVLDSSSSSDDVKKSLKNVEIVSDIFVSNSPICDDKFMQSQKKTKNIALTSRRNPRKLAAMDFKKVEDVVISDSDSDTDDFVEIQDVPIPDDQVLPKARGLQITVDPSIKEEEDMFADIFEDNLKNESSFKSVEANSTKSDTEMIVEEVENGTQEKKNDLSAEKMDVAESEEKVAAIETAESGYEKIEEVDVAMEEVNVEKGGQVAESQDSGVGSVNLSPTQEKVPESEPIVLPVNEEELQTMKATLEDEQKKITGDIGKLERQATDVTEQMRMEAQELLKLFGIPYLVAPMEAEAQCAYLESANLVDGTITDDSDVWLFGGQCIYKNFFDNNKRVLQFLHTDIQHHFNLTRRQMIQLALLVGSDYTNGISGIGPVTALEILAAFPCDGDDLLRGLMKFSDWVKAGISGSPGKLGAGLRNKLRNVQIHQGFPSQAVVQAYLFPQVDDSKEKFTWGSPNLTLLTDYAKKKFGWTKLKFDEIMSPVMKRHLEKNSQTSLQKYFKLITIPKSVEATMSKRVQSAVQRLAFDDEEGKEVKEQEEVDKKKTRKRATKRKMEDLPQEASTSGINEKSKETVQRIPSKNPDEHIPQRESDKANALNNKLKAIEVFRKSRKGPGRTKKIAKRISKVTDEAHLSESSDSS